MIQLEEFLNTSELTITNCRFVNYLATISIHTSIILKYSSSRSR